MNLLPGIGSAFATFALFSISVALCFQLLRVQQRLKAMVCLWTILLAAYVGLYRAFHGAPLNSFENVIVFANGLLIYLLLFLTFCYCYFVSDHSLSVLYMLALEKHPERKLSHQQLLEKFPYDRLLGPRMLDLETNHFVIRQGEHYELTPKGRTRARVAGTLKRFLNLEPGG